jgi:hypothetical protein
MVKTKRKSWSQADMDDLKGLIGNNIKGSKEYEDVFKISAEHWRVSVGALKKKYSKYLKGQGFHKGRIKADPNSKKKSRFWSKEDLSRLMKLVNAEKSDKEGYAVAAKEFGVTVNAIILRVKRYRKGLGMARTTLQNIQKAPVKSNMPKGYKHKKRKASTQTIKPVTTNLSRIGKKRGPKKGWKNNANTNTTGISLPTPIVVVKPVNNPLLDMVNNILKTTPIKDVLINMENKKVILCF